MNAEMGFALGPASRVTRVLAAFVDDTKLAWREFPLELDENPAPQFSKLHLSAHAFVNLRKAYYLVVMGY
jgi:hypothetical protein